MTEKNLSVTFIGSRSVIARVRSQVNL